MRNYIILIALLFVGGCASMAGFKYGDDQLAKFETENMDVTGAKVGEASANAQGQLGVNNKLSNDIRKTKNEQGNNSIFNDPKMINKLLDTLKDISMRFFIILAVIIFVPIVGIFIIMAMSMRSAESKMKLLFNQQDDLLKTIREIKSNEN